MNVPAILAIASGILCLGLGFVGIARQQRRPAQWFFAAGMTSLALEAVFNGLSFKAISPDEVIYWQKARLLAMSALPGTWLCFGFSYSRGNYGQFLNQWRSWLILTFVVPVGFTIWQRERLLVNAVLSLPNLDWVPILGWPSSVLLILFLLSAILVLVNLERTLRASVGTMRWRVKYMVLGLGLFLAVRIYTCSQDLLFSSLNLSREEVNCIALFLACLLMTVTLYRDGLFNVDIYPSQRLLQNSLTVLLVGIYLFAMGVVAKVVTLLGIGSGFPLNSLFLLLALVGATILLLSNTLRQQTNRFVNRHFRRPHYDYRHVWTTFISRTTFRIQNADLCAAVAGWISETFQLLSGTIWLMDTATGRLSYGASTSWAPENSMESVELDADGVKMIGLFREKPHPVELDEFTEPWVATLKRLYPDCFGTEGRHLFVPVVGRGEMLALMILSRRVGNAPFSDEDKDLIKCVGDQVAGSLLNIELSQRLLRLKEMEAFQAMSAFFVHDLKNTASTLSLMLQNLPVHFDEPEFRQDSLRALSKSVDRINELIGRLSLLRENVELNRTESDLAQVVHQALADLNGLPQLKVLKSLHVVPRVVMDAEQVRKVVVNLLGNALDAAGPDGQIQLETGSRPGWAWVSVADNGSGMSPEFLTQSLFRPFRTTKKKGIGIGMFLSKMIIDAHRGKIEVESQPGKGTTFRVLLPLKG